MSDGDFTEFCEDYINLRNYDEHRDGSEDEEDEDREEDVDGTGSPTPSATGADVAPPRSRPNSLKDVTRGLRKRIREAVHLHDDGEGEVVIIDHTNLPHDLDTRLIRAELQRQYANAKPPRLRGPIEPLDKDGYCPRGDESAYWYSRWWYERAEDRVECRKGWEEFYWGHWHWCVRAKLKADQG